MQWKLLCRDTSIIDSIPVWLSISKGLSVQVTSDSDSSCTYKWSALVGIYVGQSDLVSSQVEPCVHKCDALSGLVDIPLLSKSAGLSADGVNDWREGFTDFSNMMVYKWFGMSTFMYPVEHNLAVCPKVYLLNVWNSWINELCQSGSSDGSHEFQPW